MQLAKRATRMAACVLAVAWSAYAWWEGGHVILASGAMMTIPAEMPAFFRAGGVTVANVSADPDIVKNKAVAALRDAESPEHFFDIERLKGRTPPRLRSEFIGLCCELGVGPDKIGMLPYAVIEWTERLAVAFAEYRRWPSSAPVQMMALVYAGYLAHYAGDLCQPLHVTIDYDGRAKPDGSSPRTGIHAAVDGLPENLAVKPADLAHGIAPAAIDSLERGVFAEINRSRALVDKVYALESLLPHAKVTTTPDPRVAAFTNERLRRAVEFTASLYLTAWRMSEHVTLDSYLDRNAMDAVAGAKR